MVEREREVAERSGEPPRPRRVISSGALLQELRRRLLAEQIELHLDGAPHPVRPAAGDQNAGARRRNEIAQRLGRIDVVVDEQERHRRAREPRQGGARRLLLVGLAGETRVEPAGELREARNQQRAALGARPPYAAVARGVSMRILGGERGLAGAAEIVQGDLRRRRVRPLQQVVQTRERLVAAGEIGVARRHVLEYPRPCPRGDRPAFRGRQDTVAALLRIIDTDQIGEDVGGKQPLRHAVLDPQDDEPAAAVGARRRGDEMRHFGQRELRLVVVLGEQHDEVAAALERLVHGEDEVAAARDVIVLQERRIARILQRPGDLLRDRRIRAAPAEEEIDR